jgi:Asp-tRNA(Asn)/Glu-tRNA(Gln) amidotransferase A subunit family amidase
MMPQATSQLQNALTSLESVGRALNAVVTAIPNPPHAETGRLLGMPLAVKDMIDVAGHPRGNGNPIDMAGPARVADAPVVASLRGEGAALFAMASLLEYAAGAQHPDLPEARNPLDPTRTAGGSSGGSASLVGAGVCPAALGSDTGGSIRLPAHYCGVVGFKPTFGAVSVEGVQPLAPSLDHVGLLAVDVATTAEVFAVMSGVEIGQAPAILRIGILDDQLADPRLDSDVRVVVLAALERLRASGASIELVNVGGQALDSLNGPIIDIILFEAWQVHGAMMTSQPSHFGDPTARLLKSAEGVTEAAYRAALAQRSLLMPAALGLLDDVDILLGPAAPYTAPHFSPPIDTDDGLREGIFCSPFNMTGQPAIVLPCGFAHAGATADSTGTSLPVGLQLAALPGCDGLLLAAAAVVERALASSRASSQEPLLADSSSSAVN